MPMDMYEFIRTLHLLKSLANGIMSMDWKRFAEDARRTRTHAAKHGLNPEQIDKIIELAEQIEKTKVIISTIRTNSTEIQKMVGKASTN